MATLEIPLRLQGVQSVKQNSLQSRISQIHAQKGFRNVTEASLAEEIEAEKESDPALKEDVEPEAEQDRSQMLVKKRDEMLQLLRRGHNDALMALDTISLVLTKQGTKVAQLSMSPALVQAVPIKSVEARIMKSTSFPVSEINAAETVSRTYKLQGLGRAAERVLAASSRLEQEALSESRYWNEILLLKEKGWAISKVPRDPRNLGVHFGFREAALPFRNRGFAALRKNTDGSLRLDENVVPSTPLFARVSLVRNDNAIATSSMPQSSVVDADSVDQQILQARNNLFEEELFYELGREARLLANQGATVSEKQIKMPIDETTDIQIELVNLQTESSVVNSNHDQLVTDGIAVALRILLSHAHSENLRQRCQPPAPLSVKPKASPEYPLLRPIASQLRHMALSNSLQTLLDTLTRALSTAGLACSSNLSSTTTPDISTLLSTPPADLLSTLLSPPSSTSILSLPSTNSLTITLTTTLSPPSYTSVYTFSASPTSPLPWNYPSILLTLPSLPSSPDPLAAQSFLLNLLLLEASAAVISAPHPESPQRWWRSKPPHRGILVLGRQVLVLQAGGGRVGARHIRDRGAEKGESAGEVFYFWEADGRRMWREGRNGVAKELDKGLFDVARDLARESRKDQ